MKCPWLLAIIVVILGVVFAGGNVQAADLDNFTITNYDVEMQLGRDDEGRSTLRTTETITAQFPSFDQNHGIERAIPARYGSHSVGLDVISVTKPDGNDWIYSTYNDNNGNTVIRIGDADRFVRGVQTYIISYQQRDVTRHFSDTSADEFYWDINGTDWQVPINSLSLELILDEPLRPNLNGETACYLGAEGSTERCQLDKQSNGFNVSVQNLAAGENMTVAIGFESGTFEPYKMSLFERLFMIWGVLQVVLIPLAIGLIVWVVVRFVRTTNRSSELGTIVPEYLPPADTSVASSASIAKGIKSSALAAQLVDMAVRHYITITEQEQKLLIGKTKLYFIDIVKPIDDLLPEEQELLIDMFGHRPRVGESLNLKSLQNNTKYYTRTSDNDKKLRKLILDQYRLKQIDKPLKNWLRRVAMITLIISIVLLSPMLIVAALVAFILSFNARTLTDSGLALRRYLEGLKLYIKVGEQERLKMLQSPEGAQKVSTIASDTGEPRQRVVLYERVLPYAVLFGQEKDWSKQLGQYYEQIGQQPEWFSGTTAFNAAAFSSAMSGFSSTSNYASSSSSSSGGSSGGGSSGGGGGGGGGGGW